MPKLTKEEKEITKSYEKGDWRSLKNLTERATRYQKYARSTIQKDRRINIRISTRDLEGLQKKPWKRGFRIKR